MSHTDGKKTGKFQWKLVEIPSAVENILLVLAINSLKKDPEPKLARLSHLY